MTLRRISAAVACLALLFASMAFCDDEPPWDKRFPMVAAQPAGPR